jgi:alpha-mannosidase
LCVIHTGWREFPQVLLIPDLAGLAVVENDRILPMQRLPDGRTAVAFTALPVMGWQTLALVETAAADQAPAPTVIAEATLENRFFRIQINANGELATLYDKRARRHVLRAGESGNALRLYEDRPASCDAWNIDINYVEKEYPVDGVVSIEATESGPVCTAVTINRIFLHSTIRQTIRIFQDIPRIDFETDIDWHESQMLLKVDFPVDVHADDAVCGIQYGSVRRPIHANTSWEEARFEGYAHGYVDLSETGYGVSLFTGSKYGVDVLGGNLRLTLLKAPADPWPGADEGRHHFTYSLFPHRGDANEAGVYAVSASMSRTAAFILDGLEPNRCISLVSCDSEAVSVEAVKPAEDGDGLIVRLCEHANKRCTAYLSVNGQAHADQKTGYPRQIARAWQCDLLEQNETEVKRTSRGIALSFRPYEIKTIRIKLQD